MALVHTTHGELEESTLTKKEGVIDNEHERTAWTEYYIGEELVHRSVHVTLKVWPDGLGAIVADFQ
jgi:hypothetical protein